MNKSATSIVLVGGGAADAVVISAAQDFLSSFTPAEVASGVPLVLVMDKRSNACYTVCHLDTRSLATKTDLDAVLDPDESEEYKFNRRIYEDTNAYRQMESDALKGRTFEDIVVEFDPSYRPKQPLKVFGGQHRVQAIRASHSKGVLTLHGTRVYFSLSKEQRASIAQVNNTAISVPNDLLDRMQEEMLGPQLREWAQTVGLLSKGENFADRRNAEGLPTTRIARTFVVNFLKGKDGGALGLESPVVCDSGPAVDPHYTEWRDKVDWKSPEFLTAGREFARLHSLQRETVLSREQDSYTEFANKVIHPCVVAAWAFAAGSFQRDEKALEAHYRLTDSVSRPDDPLNAAVLLRARLKGVDKDTYRGLGSRISGSELGRMLEVFVLQARQAKRPGITQKLADAAIKNYEAKRQSLAAKKAVEDI